MKKKIKTKHHRKNKKTNKTRQLRRSRSRCGGKVIDAGGFGCVFRPAIKCSGKKRRKNSISKLLTADNAKQEFEDITRYKSTLQKIRNYENYFILENIELCRPAPLTQEDLRNYSKKCDILVHEGIDKKNINDPSSLDKLLSINMAYGGKEFGDTLITSRHDYQKLIDLNKSMIRLLHGGILPMNEKNIYHGDIKASNILIDDNVHARLIDWGMSFTYENKEEEKIPHSMTHRPFQFNLPFSVVMFNKMFDDMYADFFRKNPYPDYYIIRSFVIAFLRKWNEDNQDDHASYIRNIFKEMFSFDLDNTRDINEKGKNNKSLNTFIDFEYTYYYITEYISEIIYKYTKDFGKFDKNHYFKNIFIKTLDVYGFLVSYFPWFEMYVYNTDTLNDIEVKLFHHFKYIFIHYLFERRTSPIDVNKLTQDLERINAFLVEGTK
jgi:hypothetical protein